jgi:DNA-binding NarL/FixJ family response regulator
MHTRFLIVDDSELVRKSLRTVLETNPGWEIVAEAADGATAVELFKRTHPHVGIVDFQMPGLNGVETARRILQIDPAVPIILFTQHASPGLEKYAQEVGIRSVVSKMDAFPMVGIIEALLAGDNHTGPNNELPTSGADCAEESQAMGDRRSSAHEMPPQPDASSK